MTKDLTVVVPTFNEHGNVRALLDRLETVLDGVSWEVVFVDDDSPDGTSDLVREIAARDDRVRCLQRIGRRGLSSACIEGMLASASPYLAVIDADLQHDESLLPRMLAVLKADSDVEIVVGSRYMEGGSTGDWGKERLFISRFATRLGQKLLKVDLSDPMSGFFMIRRSAFEAAVRQLSGKGFKILLDLFASSPRPLKFAELPFEFRERHAGDSKLDTLVVWEYFLLLAEKVFGPWLPVRFLMFLTVGGMGLVVHLSVLGLLLRGFGVAFAVSQALAVAVAMVFNFGLNNVFTYRDQRLRGWAILYGLLSFCAACSLGAFINYATAVYLYGLDFPWWLSGFLGAVVGAVWNYAISSVFTWRRGHARG